MYFVLNTFYAFRYIYFCFRGGLRFHLINVEMNTEILVSLEIIFYFWKKEKPKRKYKKKRKIMVTRRRSLKHNIKRNNNNKFISVLLIVNYVNFFMITLQSYCWLFASRLMIAIWCMRYEGRVINIKKKYLTYLSMHKRSQKLCCKIIMRVKKRYLS